MIHICHVFIQFSADLLDSLICGYLRKDLELDELNVSRLIVLEKEMFEASNEVLLSSLSNDEVDVRDDIVTDLIAVSCFRGGHESDERSCESTIDLFLKEAVSFGDVEEDLDCSQED